jgi:microcystin-dependent protein
MSIDRMPLTDRNADDFASLDDINDAYHAINSLKESALDRTESLPELTTGSDSAGDRGLQWRLTASDWLRFWWDNANALFKISNQAGALQKIAFANGTEATHGVTKGQLDALQSNLDTVADQLNHVEPPGVIKLFAGASAPGGFLLCAGQAVSRTTYGVLFSAIGDVYGAGDGSSTFNIPDLRGRFPLGKDDMGGTAANRVTSASNGGTNASSLGGNGGEETHTLSISELPGHTHDIIIPSADGSSVSSGVSSGLWEGDNSIPNTPSGSTGGGEPHNIMPPWLALNYIIKI